MTTWEYMIIDSKRIGGGRRIAGPSHEDAERYLSQLGAEGWEVVSLDWRELERRMSFMGVAKRRRPVQDE